MFEDIDRDRILAISRNFSARGTRVPSRRITKPVTEKEGKKFTEAFAPLRNTKVPAIDRKTLAAGERHDS